MHSLSELASSFNGRSLTILRVNNKETKECVREKERDRHFFYCFMHISYSKGARTYSNLNTYPNLYNFHS